MSIIDLLGTMAFKTLQGTCQGTGQVPVILLEPQTEADHQMLEQHTELALKAMINAAKADGQIDEEEILSVVTHLGNHRTIPF